MTHPNPSERFVTTAELEAMEGRVISRLSTAINEAETRLVRDLNTAFWRQLALLVGLVAILSGLFSILIVRLFAVTDQLQATVNQLTRTVT